MELKTKKDDYMRIYNNIIFRARVDEHLTKDWEGLTFSKRSLSIVFCRIFISACL